MSRKATALSPGFGIAAFLLLAVLLIAEIWNLSPGPVNPIFRQVTAALGDPPTQWLILLALTGYFILFGILEHRLSPPVRWWRPGNADLWLSAMIALALLRFPFATQNRLGFSYVATVFAGIVFGKAVSTLIRWRSGDPARRTAWFACCLIGLLAGAALWQPALGRMRIQYHEIVRWSGLWRNPNYYGVMMGAGLVLAIGMGVRAWRAADGQRRKFFLVALCSAAAIFSGYGAFRSYSRGAWLGVLTGLAYLAVQAGNSSRPWAWLRRHRLTLALLIASLTVLTFWQFRFSDWPPAHRVFSVVNINDFSWRNRVASWKWAVQSMAERPLAGSGWSRPVQPANPPNYSPPQNSGSALGTNDYLMLGTSAGVPALLCFAAYLALCFRARPAAPRPRLSVFAICRGSSIVFLVGFWLDGGLFVLAVTMVFWMLFELSRLEPAEATAGGAGVEEKNEPGISCAISQDGVAVAAGGGEAHVPQGAGGASSPGPAASPEGALLGSRDEGVAATFCDGASQLPAPRVHDSISSVQVSRSRGELWLRRTSLALAAIALVQSAVYVGTPFFPVNQWTLALGRKCLVPPVERSDLDYLAPDPIWTGRQLRVLLQHVDLANYNRRLVNWTLDDSMYREYVLTPGIQPGRDGLLRWRRPLWEFFYPGIRKLPHDQDAAKFVLQQLRHAVVISPEAPATIEDMWRRKMADAKGFEALCVAAFRSVGIPARLGGDGRTEFFDGKVWQPVSSLAT
jgi:hypothetical protein